MSGPLEDCVAVVDDEFLIATGLTMQLEDMGMRVCGTAATADEAVSLAQAARPAVVLMDVRLAGQKDGIDAALAIHETVGSKVIFVTGSREAATIARIEQDHPAGLLFKPVLAWQLREAISAALAS
ncbi:MAG TPA: response regulator [Phenylobacterium sp.]|jgi:DNA-binding NarL/FixJ family response regulator|uniref:response regulator n=1 Tax=Phenylobacterium sp. TaxID=1871053 RepID=UPI002C5A4BBF|nr:response regulator [Phenylobacterium sp.]HXA40719.1 response regulator [Phenylobacterium sp.]